MPHSMYWSTAAHRDGQSNFITHGLPSFQFDSDDVRRGAVKVNAKSPSGRTVTLSVIDNGGVFTTNFTPTEIGDWLISILFDGRHIEGSPFTVRVYDPSRVRVLGLTGGIVGKSFLFEIDTTEAGEGQLQVEITNRGRQIPAQIIPDTNGRFQVSFTPQGPGLYNIKVFFAGTEIAGSPFTLEIISSNDVTVSGEGLGFVQVGRPSSFVVYTGRNDDDSNLMATVRATSRNQRIGTQFHNNHDGSYRVEYTPNDVGEHQIEVNYHGNQVPGSPFVSQAFDSRKVLVGNLDSSAVTGQQVEFDIDANQAGCGNIEIIVNDGQVPCSVKQLSSHKFHASFVPLDATVHYVDMTFNGCRLAGSPWRVDVQSSREVTATGSGLKLVPIGKTASFHVIGCLATSRITTTILSPSGRNIATNVFSQRDGTFNVEYIPLEVGNYKVAVECDNTPIISSPWTVKAYNTSGIKVQNIPVIRTVGSPVEFTVDVNDAGEGQLEIMVNRGLVPNTVRMISKGVFQISFIPRDSRPHTVDIRFNGEPLPQGATTFTILDVGRVIATGDGLQRAAVNKPSTFHVDTANADDTELSIRISAVLLCSTATDNTSRELPVIIRKNMSKGFDVDYTTREPGTYKIDITYGNIHINGSPFTVQSYDPNSVKVHDINDGIVGKPSSFIVDVASAGEGNLELSITSPNGSNIPNQVKPIRGETSCFEVTYTPIGSGVYRANILFNDEHVPGSPFKFHVSDVTNVTVAGSGLTSVGCNKPATFTVTSRDIHQQDLDINITAPNGRLLRHKAYPSGSQGFVIEYTPLITGEHRIEIKYQGVPIVGSPFTVNVWDASQVVVSNLRPGHSRKPSTFNVDASRAGAGNLEIIVSVGAENIPNFVSADGGGRFQVEFTPIKPEAHSISVKFSNDHVPGSPFTFELMDTVKVIPLNDSLIRIPIGRPAVVAIDPGKGALQDAQPVCEVTGPSDKVMRGKVSTVTGQSNMWKAQFIPREIGPHCIQMTVADIEIVGSPFACEVYDASRVEVNIQSRAVVGKPYDFEVDLGSAGAGDLDVVVKSNSYRVPTRVIDKGFRVFAVQFMPKAPTRHLAYVTFVNESVPGSPFVIDVEDNTMVEVRGLTLESAPVMQPVHITIDPSKAPFRADARVSITGPPPTRNRVPFDITGNFINGWTVEWIPYELGVYSIEIKYGPSHVTGSPFKCKVFDLSKVIIIRDFDTGNTPSTEFSPEEVVFYVDASEAGAGNLEVVVHSTKTGARLPNFLEAVDRTSGRFRIRFTPRPDCFNYRVDVSFNDLAVASSPFYHAVLDGRRATASGEGLELCIANRSTSFDVKTKSVGGEAELEVSIRAPSGRSVPAQVSGSGQTGYRVVYTPTEAGRHEVGVKYADVDVTGSPFYAEVYDPSQVIVSGVPQRAVLGQPASFQVDSSGAGEGKLSVSCRGRTSQPYADVVKKSPTGRHLVSLVPTESGLLSIDVHFNGMHVAGSPFHCDVIDTSAINVHWESVRMCQIHRPAQLDIDLYGMTSPEVAAVVTDPYGREVAVNVLRLGVRHIIEFTPKDVGPHSIDVHCAGQAIAGSPYTANVYDTTKVQLLDPPSSGIVGNEVSMIVDTCEAGLGDVDVKVTCNSSRIQTRRQLLSEFCQQFTFLPVTAGSHLVTVTFNDQNITGSPFMANIVELIHQMSLSNKHEGAVVNSQAFAIIETQGAQVNLDNYLVRVTAPNGELVPARMIQQSNGDCRMEYSSRHTGRHLVEIMYSGRPVMGSPFYVEIYDPSRVFVEDIQTSWNVGDLIEFDGPGKFDVINHNAGKADLGLTITGPHGSTIPFNIQHTDRGNHVTYMARDPGFYLVNLTYGGLTVPRCPIRHEVLPSAPVLAYGEGLVSAIQDKVATFVVDSKGQRGELNVQVDGPNSIARCTVQPVMNGMYKVSYIPVEVGVYNITVKWTGNHVAGSPFRAKVVDPEKVQLIGNIDSVTNTVKLALNQVNSIDLDTRNAGPGQLTAEVRCAEGLLPVDITQKSRDYYSVSFVPHLAGDHHIRLLWNNILIYRCPLIGQVDVMTSSVNRVSATPPLQAVNQEKVILTGHGLQTAKVNQQAEFVIDATEATPGYPGVKLNGLHTDVVVQCSPLGGQKYQCTYVPTLPGAYLLYITWSNRQVRGSPFKVTVTSASNASKVICSGEGLRGGILGQDITASIDARRAGSGELISQCQGPNMLAYCELVDHRDGTFTLHITPKEAGRHVLDIQYGGDRVPGSPFTLQVSSNAIASKVAAYGPGLEHGLLTDCFSQFTVDTTGAGSGLLTVRIRGPKGAFRVEMQRDGRNDRVIQCRFDPTEVGVYIIQVLWSGKHVPESPFVVHICGSASELERVLRSANNDTNHGFEINSAESPSGYMSDNYYID